LTAINEPIKESQLSKENIARSKSEIDLSNINGNSSIENKKANGLDERQLKTLDRSINRSRNLNRNMHDNIEKSQTRSKSRNSLNVYESIDAGNLDYTSITANNNNSSLKDNSSKSISVFKSSKKKFAPAPPQSSIQKPMQQVAKISNGSSTIRKDPNQETENYSDENIYNMAKKKNKAPAPPPPSLPINSDSSFSHSIQKENIIQTAEPKLKNLFEPLSGSTTIEFKENHRLLNSINNNNNNNNDKNKTISNFNEFSYSPNKIKTHSSPTASSSPTSTFFQANFPPKIANSQSHSPISSISSASSASPAQSSQAEANLNVNKTSAMNSLIIPVAEIKEAQIHINGKGLLKETPKEINNIGKF
jgi:hypothetical protein